MKERKGKRERRRREGADSETNGCACVCVRMHARVTERVIRERETNEKVKLKILKNQIYKLLVWINKVDRTKKQKQNPNKNKKE